MASSTHKDRLHPKRKFAESSSKTLVGIQKTEVQYKKMLDDLERQQNTSVNNIANHQQAMKMSWRRLEERRSQSPTLVRAEKKDPKNTKKGLMLHSNTKLYVKKTPEIYNPEAEATSDDNGTTDSHDPGILIQRKKPLGPPPTQLTRPYTSPYLSSPYNFRKSNSATMRDTHELPTVEGDAEEENASPGTSNTKLSDSQEFNTGMSSSSQPMLLSSNDKSSLLKASDLMGMESSSSGPSNFKVFYNSRPRSRAQGNFEFSTSPLATHQLAESILVPNHSEEQEVSASSSELTLAEQFEQIKNCRYIRHYYPDGTALEEYH